MKLLNTLLILGLLNTVQLSAQNVNIPDANFKTYLVGNTNINANGDTEIQMSEAIAFTGKIDCSSQNIVDLTGIGAFINLTELWCYTNQLTNLNLNQNTSLVELQCGGNQLTSLDLSQNISLRELQCGGNKLTSLNVGQNTNLLTLRCPGNELVSLDVSQNVDLLDLRCHFNELTNLDISQNVNLTLLGCGGNQLTSLNLSQNINLTGVYCSSNQLISLDVSQNPNLVELYCNSNELVSLDVSQNINLVKLYCRTNQLISLDVSQNPNLTELFCLLNKLTSLDVKNGNNINFSVFYATQNPNLTCIRVDDSTYSTANWTNIDTTASFSTNCNLLSTVNTIDENIDPAAYPNPTTKGITLKLGKSYNEVNVQVRNITGKTILSRQLKNISTTTLELEGAAGLYFINIQTEEGQEVLKVVKK